MILLAFSQGDDEIALGLFQSIEKGRAFLETVPGYKRVDEVHDEEVFTYETVDPNGFEDYFEVEYCGNRFPLTKHMFSGTEQVDVLWYELPVLDVADQGLIEGGTRVDAYVVDNLEVRDYIETREKGFQRVRRMLEEFGYQVTRDFAGSEDGEAILVSKGEDERILAYLDPGFLDVAELDDQAMEEWIKTELENWK